MTMDKKQECSIVQDLLPNYIDNLTNEETNLLIEKHLAECEACQKMLDTMQKEVKLKGKKREEREVKYMKKINHKLAFLKGLIIIILIIALGVVSWYCSIYKQNSLLAVNELYETLSEDIYPDVFYGTITEIVDDGINQVREVKMKGLEINDEKHRETITFLVSLDEVGKSIKIKWQGKDVSFEELEVGQTIAVYEYSKVEYEPNTLNSVKMITILK